MAQTTLSKEQQVIDWTKSVSELVKQVEGWCAELGWPSARQPKTIREKALGSYHVDDLVIKTPSGVLILDVKARNVINAEGRIDLYLLHNLSRVLLIRKGERWALRTESGVRWPKPWNKEAFAQVPELVATPA